LAVSTTTGTNESQCETGEEFDCEKVEDVKIKRERKGFSFTVPSAGKLKPRYQFSRERKNCGDREKFGLKNFCKTVPTYSL
jgi:hypothetical protein